MSATPATTTSDLKLTHGNWKTWSTEVSIQLRQHKVYGLSVQDWDSLPEKLEKPEAPATDASAAVASIYTNNRRAYESRNDDILNWKRRNEQAEGIILSALDSNERATVGTFSSAHDLWTQLEKKHKDEYAGLLGFEIFRSLTRSQYDPETPMRDHVAFLRSQNQLLGQSSADRKLPDDFLAFALFSSVDNDPSWQTVISATLGSLDSTSKLTFETAATRFINEADQRRLRDSTPSQSAALAAKTGNMGERGKGGRPKCDHCHLLGHVAERCWILHPELKPKGKGKERDASRGKKKKSDVNETRAALSAAKKAHRAAKAEAVMSSDSSSESDMDFRPQKANLASISGTRTFALITSIFSSSDSIAPAASANLANLPRQALIIDSGCTRTMGPHRKWFRDYRLLDKQIPVSLGDDSTVPAIGRGLVRFQSHLPSGATVEVDIPMLHVPALSTSLISVRQITGSGKTSLSFTGPDCRVYERKSKTLVLHATSINDSQLYELSGHVLLPPAPPKQKVHSHSARTLRRDVDINVLHQRLGHLNFGAVRQLVRAGQVRGVKGLVGEEKFCEACVMGKHHRQPFPDPNFDTAIKARAPLDRIHSDVAGPFPLSIGKKRFMLTIIDEFSRHVDVRFMAHKSDVANELILWIAAAERMHNRKVKCLRSDNGGEYMSSTLQDFLKSSGIQHETTAPDTPEQDGLAERMNRTIQDRMLTIMNDANLSQGFWAEIAFTTAYLINRSPSAGLQNQSTPHEKWTGNKPSVRHLRRIGSLAYAHVPKDQRRKLDFRAKRCILIGYYEDSKSYRLWDGKRIRKCRDVEFNEEGAYAGDGKPPFVPLPTGPDDHNPDSPSLSPPPTSSRSPALDDDTEHRAQDAEDVILSDGNDGGGGEAPPPPAPPPRRRQTEVERLLQDAEGHSVGEGEGRTRSERHAAATMAISGSDSHAFALHAAAGVQADPKTYREAMQRPDADEWEKAVSAEFKALDEHDVMTECVLPPGRKAVGARFVFRLKRDTVGRPIKHKGRLVAQGFTQLEGVDFFETFSPVARLSSIRTLLSLGVQLGLELRQYDFDSAYLNADLDEEVYIHILDHCQRHGKVYRLHKALYGLKQSGRAWYEHIKAALLEEEFTPLESEPSIYVLDRDGEVMYIGLYVDDLLLLSSNMDSASARIDRIGEKYRLRMLANSTETDEFSVLGIAITYNLKKREVTLNQRQYITDMLHRFNLTSAKPAPTPLSSGYRPSKTDSPSTDNEAREMAQVPYRSLIGCLMYAAIATRPDISFAVGALSKFNANPGKTHWREAKRILRYLSGTPNLSIRYHRLSLLPLKRPDITFDTFADADWAGNRDNLKSTSGWVTLSGGGPVNWSSRLQGIQAMSSGEAEYISSANAGQEMSWMRNFFTELGVGKPGPSVLHLDSVSAIQWNNNPASHGRTKHIDLKYHYTRHLVEDGRITIRYVPSAQMPADVLTKSLGANLQKEAVRLLGMANGSSGSVES